MALEVYTRAYHKNPWPRGAKKIWILCEMRVVAFLFRKILSGANPFDTARQIPSPLGAGPRLLRIYLGRSASAVPHKF